ncbi:MAG: hypothetical protein Kow0069_01920 [Promethearchaeota archaeon]
MAYSAPLFNFSRCVRFEGGFARLLLSRVEEKSMVQTIRGDWDIRFHPGLKVNPKEVVFMYSLDGKNWDDYYANRLGVPTHWQVTVYDLPVGQKLWFFLQVHEKDGRIRVANKDGDNYEVTVNPGKTGAYRAEVRVSKLVVVGRICLLCETRFGRQANACPNPGCGATYCPTCSRMLPPKANFCPWCQQDF